MAGSGSKRARVGRRLAAVGLGGALALATSGMAAGSTTREMSSREPRAGALRAPQRSAGYLTPAPSSVYARAKAAADRSAGLKPAGTVPGGPLLPVPGPSWEGEFQSTVVPSDSTGAVGPSRYIELVNQRYGIYGKTGALVSDGDLGMLTGHPVACLVNPQILWDTAQVRFFYVVLDACTNVMAWGFSKTASPSTNADFCPYTADFGYGADLPDYPRLGNSFDFLLIGVNVFAGGVTYVRSDLAWINKVLASASCPPASSFGLGVFEGLTNCGGATLATTPVPTVMTDGTHRTFMVSTHDVSDGSTKDHINVWGIRQNPINPSIPQLGTANCVEVDPYTLPPDAPQCSSAKLLDTLDGRLEHAVLARDPANGNIFAIWTAHSVAGGAGAEERWYEIDPLPLAAPTLFQNGEASGGGLYEWNGTISPDRAVGAPPTFGDSMVMGFNTSSATACSAIQMVSKIGAGAQSAFVLVKQSPGPNEDFTCGVCRWGDFSGASPDPLPPAGIHGKVWLTGQWNVKSPEPTGADWRTWNWGATP